MYCVLFNKMWNENIVYNITRLQKWMIVLIDLFRLQEALTNHLFIKTYILTQLILT